MRNEGEEGLHPESGMGRVWRDRIGKNGECRRGLLGKMEKGSKRVE